MRDQRLTVGAGERHEPMLPWWPVPRPLHGPLNIPSIASAALELVDEGGDRNLSMRRLAERLDTSPMALYWHVANRAELLSVLRDTALAPVRAAVEEAVGWREVLSAQAIAIHEHIGVAHPNLVSLVFSVDHVPGPNTLAIIDRSTTVLLDEGFGPREAIAAMQLVTTLALAFSEDIGSSDLAQYARHDVDGYPGLDRLLGTDTPIDRRARFDVALRFALAGIEAEIASGLRNNSGSD